MVLKLVSADRELYKLCVESLAEVLGADGAVTVLTPEEYTPGPGLFLWEFQPDAPFPESLPTPPSRHLFLVHKDDLESFYRKPNARNAAVLLKPVTRATMASFLSFAAAVDQQCGVSAGSLRADRDDILQCLIQTNLKLQEYDQGRTNFLARAVHDFRAPLTALCGYCDLLMAEPLGALNQQQKEVLRRMLHSTKRLSRMATSMFQLSAGRQLNARLDLRPGDLRECVEQALHEISPFAEEKHIATTVDLGACPDSVYFEGKQIERLLINLLDNACKFTPKAGTIDIRGYPFFWDRRHQTVRPVPHERRRECSREPNSYRVDVHDSGAAIPKERLRLIFKEYVSYAEGSDRSSTGLGLAICRAIVAQHDGLIWAENSPSGPTFSFVLPSRAVKSMPDLGRQAAYPEVSDLQ